MAVLQFTKSGSELGLPRGPLLADPLVRMLRTPIGAAHAPSGAQASPGNVNAISPSGSWCIFWAPSQKGQWEASGGQPLVGEQKMYNLGKQTVH